MLRRGTAARGCSWDGIPFGFARTALTDRPVPLAAMKAKPIAPDSTAAVVLTAGRDSKSTGSAAAATSQAAVEPIYADPDPTVAKTFIQPSPEAVKEVVMYGELAQITYDSFRNKKQIAQVLTTPRFGDSGFEEVYKEDSMDKLMGLLQPNSLARKRGYKCKDYLYANSGWYLNDIERVVNNGVSDLINKEDLEKQAGKEDPVPRKQTLASYLQEQYNWIGFCAISDAGPDEKSDLAIVFRGTQTWPEWAADLDATLIGALPWEAGIKVAGSKNLVDSEPADAAKDTPEQKRAKICKGFKSMYAKPSEGDPAKRRPPQAQLHQNMDFFFRRSKESFNIGTITCVGHSLGAALATVCAFDLARDSCVPDDVEVRVCTFEGPKAGDEHFAACFKGMDVRRVINVRDVVTSVPGLTVLALRQLQEALGDGKPAQVADKSSGNQLPQKIVSALVQAGKNPVARFLAVGAAEIAQAAAAQKFNLFNNDLLGSFTHVANPIALDTSSPRLKGLTHQPGDIWGCHNLEMVLYMLDPSRDPCLIDKGSSILLNVGKECENWWGNSSGEIVPPTCPGECHPK